MKTYRISAAAALLSLTSLGALAAQTPGTTAANATDTVTQSPEQAQPDGAPSPPCMQTGSRLPRKGGCVNAAGQVVTREELDATGAMTLGDALRRTVPSATIR